MMTLVPKFFHLQTKLFEQIFVFHNKRLFNGRQVDDLGNPTDVGRRAFQTPNLLSAVRTISFREERVGRQLRQPSLLPSEYRRHICRSASLRTFVQLVLTTAPFERSIVSLLAATRSSRDEYSSHRSDLFLARFGGLRLRRRLFSFLDSGFC